MRLILAVVVLVGLASCSKRPVMCCLQDKGVFCTPEIKTDEVGANEGRFCAVSTDIFKARTTAEAAKK